MKNITGLLHFLVEHSNIKLLVFSVIGGIINGIITVLLISNINEAVVDQGNKLLFFLLLLFAILTNIISSYFLIKLSEHNLFQIRKSIVDSILESEYRELELFGAGKIYSSLSQDVAILSNTASLIPHIISSFSIVVASLIYIASLSVGVGLLLITSMTVGVSVYFILQKPIYKNYNKNRDNHNNLHSYYNSLIYGNRELRSDSETSDKLTNTIFLKTLESIRSTKIKSGILESLAGAWGTFVVFIALGSIVYVFPIISIDENLSSSIISSIVTAIIFTLGSVYSIVGLFPALISASISHDRIQSIVLKAEQSNFETKILDCNTIKFEKIKHSYKTSSESEGFIFGPITFSIKKSEITLITGGNGSGKTTLQKLITGIYKIDSGNITCGNHVISSKDISNYRKLFNVVWSDCFIFDNLYIDDDQKDRFEFWLNRLSIKDKIIINNSNKLVNHKELSSGQKKRLSLAIALAKAKNFIVLDEWAAEQSPDFKNIFYREIIKDLKDQKLGVVIISHDDRYFDVADKIITLENGTIVEVSKC